MTTPLTHPHPAPDLGSSPTSPDLGSSSTGPDLEALRRQLRGRLSTPGDGSWDRARQAWNLAVDQHPVAVADVRDAADVRVAIRFAAANGSRVAMQATGHGAATLASLEGTLLVRTAAMDGIDVDPAARRARVEAGVLARDLVSRAAEHGLAFPAGSSEDVGVIGYTLGGGVGWLGRAHGLACNHVTAAEVITADGEMLRVDHDRHPELFWALRGGGGSFAAVTAIEVKLHPIRQVHAGMLSWPLDRAAEVLHVWRVWTQEVPDEVTSIARLLRYPPLPDLPDHLRGRSFVAVEVSFLDGEREADQWLRPLRVLRPPLDTFATVGAPALGQLHGDPAHPVPAIADHRLLGHLSAEGVESLLDVVGPSRPSSLLSVDIRHLGGAMGVPRPEHGVLDRLDAGYALYAVGLPLSPDTAAQIRTDLVALGTAAAPWDAGTAYLNFADTPIDPARLFGDHRFTRLRAAKRTYDPHDRFLSNHPIPA